MDPDLRISGLDTVNSSNQLRSKAVKPTGLGQPHRWATPRGAVVPGRVVPLLEAGVPVCPGLSRSQRPWTWHRPFLAPALTRGLLSLERERSGGSLLPPPFYTSIFEGKILGEGVLKKA